LPAIEALIPLAHDAAALASFTPGQMLAVFIALLFLIISGFVSGSEIAYFSLTQQQIDDLQESPKGPAIKKLLSYPERLLATILIANNLVNVTIVVLLNFALGPVFENMPEYLSFILQTNIDIRRKTTKNLGKQQHTWLGQDGCKRNKGGCSHMQASVGDAG